MLNRNTQAVAMLVDLGYPPPCFCEAQQTRNGPSRPEVANRPGVPRPTGAAKP